MKKKVVAIDDSALIRQIYTEIIGQDPELELIATFSNPVPALQKIPFLNPDIIILDVEMPHMDGIEALKKIMDSHPTPVLMISSLTEEGAKITLEALSLGAVDFLAKPKMNIEEGFNNYKDLLSRKIKSAANAKVIRKKKIREEKKEIPKVGREAAKSNEVDSRFEYIGIGSSTGGVEALRYIFSRVEKTYPPIFIVQHMPKMFTAMFAKNLNLLTGLEIKEAEQGEIAQNNFVYVAPGDKHMIVQKKEHGIQLNLIDERPVNHHKPSVDVLFNSMSRINPKKSLAIILTGMGNDGAKEIKNLKSTGAYTIAQDQASSVVFGMPQEAIRLQGATKVLNLDEIVRFLNTKF